MSDGGLRVFIEQMETWVADPSWVPEPEILARWHTGFQAALDRAEKGPDWPDLMAKAHTVGQQLETIAARYAGLRDEMKAELEAFERGDRALKGYRASVR